MEEEMRRTLADGDSIFTSTSSSSSFFPPRHLNADAVGKGKQRGRNETRQLFRDLSPAVFPLTPT